MEESMKLKVFQLSDWLHDIFWVIFIDAEKNKDMILHSVLH
jgi:hypothetical protein